MNILVRDNATVLISPVHCFIWNISTLSSFFKITASFAMNRETPA